MSQGMDIELLQQQRPLPELSSRAELSNHDMNIGSYLPPVRVTSGLSVTRASYEREVDNEQMSDLDIICMNAYLEHGRRAWRALFAIIFGLLLICGLCIVCHKLRNTEYLIGWLLFAMLAPVGLFLQRSVKEFIGELHCSSRAIVRVRSVDARNRHIISAFERLIERVVSTNINDANLYFDSSANEAHLATTCYDQWHVIDAQRMDSSSAGQVQLCISRGDIHLTGRDNCPKHELSLIHI